MTPFYNTQHYTKHHNFTQSNTTLPKATPLYPKYKNFTENTTFYKTQQHFWKTQQPQHKGLKGHHKKMP